MPSKEGAPNADGITGVQDAAKRGIHIGMSVGLAGRSPKPFARVRISPSLLITTERSPMNEIKRNLIERMRKDAEESAKIPWYMKRYMPAIKSMRKVKSHGRVQGVPEDAQTES